MKNRLFVLLAILTSFVTCQSVGAEDSCLCSCNDRIEIGGAWLYWKAEQDNLEYAANVNASNTTINSTILRPEFTYCSGYRAFASYLLCDPQWKIGAIFSHLDSSAKNRAENDPTSVTNFIVVASPNFPILTALNQNNINFFSISSKWTASINYLDLDVSRDVSLCHYFDITLHMGLRGLWMKQQFHIDGPTPEVQSAQMGTHISEHFDGYGVEGGLNGALQLGCGFSLIGHLGGSLLYARIEDNQNLTLTTLEQPLSIRAGETIHHLSPMVDTLIGLQYENRCWGCPLCLQIGWEQHIIVNANHFSIYKFADVSVGGLTLQGSIGF